MEVCPHQFVGVASTRGTGRGRTARRPTGQWPGCSITVRVTGAAVVVSSRVTRV